MLARIAKQPVDKSLFSKVRDFLKGDEEVIGRVILQSIKNGKVKIKHYEVYKDPPVFLQKFDLEIGNLPIEFKRIKRFRGVLDYYLDIPFFDIKKLKVSDSISEKIFQSIFAQLKKESYVQLFESENHKEFETRPQVFYSFARMPNRNWVTDDNKIYSEEFFDDKDFDEYQFDNFFDMDQMFGHKNSLFGTRGLEVGNPKRTSRSFDMYNSRVGPGLVRVLKTVNDL